MRESSGDDSSRNEPRPSRHVLYAQAVALVLIAVVLSLSVMAAVTFGTMAVLMWLLCLAGRVTSREVPFEWLAGIVVAPPLRHLQKTVERRLAQVRDELRAAGEGGA